MATALAVWFGLHWAIGDMLEVVAGTPVSPNTAGAILFKLVAAGLCALLVLKSRVEL
jgi:hypothetical protein